MLGVQMKRIRIGYMRVKEFRGLVRLRVEPVSKEEVLRILRGGSSASES